MVPGELQPAFSAVTGKADGMAVMLRSGGDTAKLRCEVFVWPMAAILAGYVKPAEPLTRLSDCKQAFGCGGICMLSRLDRPHLSSGGIWRVLRFGVIG